MHLDKKKMFVNIFSVNITYFELCALVYKIIVKKYKNAHKF